MGSAHHCPGSPISGDKAKQGPQKRREGDGERYAGAGGQQKEAESRPQGGAKRQMGTSVEVKTYSWEFKRPRTLHSMRTWVIQGPEMV